LAVSGCTGSHVGSPTTRARNGQTIGLRFVAATAELLAACRATAEAVDYPVPCPTVVPKGLTETGGGGPGGCALHIIGPGGIGGCARSWRGWIVGSSAVGGEHLVITGSPKPLVNYAKVVNGPAWYPTAEVEPLVWVRVSGRRMRAVYVPPSTNDGSAFADHVVLIWTTGTHTYGIGFHRVGGLTRTLRLDLELAKHISLIRP
jgi:hypothetical protein